MFRLWPRPVARPARPADFVAFVHDRIVLYHPPRWPLVMTPARFVAAGVSDLIELAGWFGFPFATPVEIWLFPTCAALGTCFRVKASGVALTDRRVVAVAGDVPDPVAVLRHELAHLVSASWGGMTPSLKCEGLTVWWEAQPDRRAAARRLNAACRDALRRGPLPELTEMLDDRFFCHPDRQELCYALAGSFAGWLVTRKGWPRYREFFRRAGPTNFVPAFEDVFEMRFAEADQRWRVEAIPRRGLMGC